MILYLDSSALVKLFVAEQASETVHDFVHKADVVTPHGSPIRKRVQRLHAAGAKVA